MTWPKDYELAGQLSIQDYMRESFTNPESFLENLNKIEVELNMKFEIEEGRTGKTYAVCRIKNMQIRVSIDGLNKIRVGYDSKTSGRSHLVPTWKDAKIYIKTYKAMAEAGGK